MPRWTEDQLEAIEDRGHNLLVSAAAGSGKTAVLVERIIKLALDDGVDIDKFLIVTFTNSAAGEMRERILSAFNRKLAEEDENGETENIKRQINLLGKASITTLHSFCINVLKNYFYKIDLDPNFRIIEPTEGSVLMQEILEDLLEEEYGKENEDFVSLVECYTGDRDDLNLEKLILNVYRFIQSQPDSIRWMFEMIEKYNVDIDGLMNGDWVDSIAQDVENDLEFAKDIIEKAVLISKKPSGPAEYSETLESDLDAIEQLLEMARKRDLENLAVSVRSTLHSRLPRSSKDGDKILVKRVQELRQDYKDKLKKMREGIFYSDIDSYLEEMRKMYPPLKYLGAMVESFSKMYFEKKREKNMLDFNDLEHLALKVLDDEEAKTSLRSKYQYIFVDEYQDSNIIQETIIDRIKREDNLFLVGDVKQSIYRFRLADPTLFIEKYYGYIEDQRVNDKRVDLSQNFRSRKAIIDAVNFIFKNTMSRRLGEIDYTEDVYLYNSAEYGEIEDGEIELNIIEKKTEEEFELEDSLLDMADAELEARFVVDKVKGLVGKKTYDIKLGGYRDIEYKDVVVLLRTIKDWAVVYEEILSKEGIPVYTDSNSGYFSSVEVQVFLNLLSVIDNKMQDIPLISTMRSFIGKFTLEELMEIRIHSQEGSFYEAIESYIDEIDDGLTSKLERFISNVEKWKNQSRFYKLDEFIWRLLIQTDYYYYAGTLSNGKQRQANLSMLVDKANEFEKSSISGLFNFLRFSDRLKDMNSDIGTAKTLGENENVVRIMSVHKSKGLEFPVVILGGLGKRFNMMDLRNDFVFHKDLGIGINYVDHERRMRKNTMAKMAITNRARIEGLSEEMRILYVAMTRAKDRLIMYGTVKDLDKSLDRWSKGNELYNLAGARSFLDWIGISILKHKDAAALIERLEKTDDTYIEHLCDDDSRWKINVLEKKEMLRLEEKKNVRKEQLQARLEECKSQDIRSEAEQFIERLNWKYEYIEETLTPSRFSVTDISSKDRNKRNIKIPATVEYPKFMQQEKALSGSDIGNLIHELMENIEFEGEWAEERLDAKISELIERDMITDMERESIDKAPVMKFLSGDLYSRIRNSTAVYKEQPFIYKIDENGLSFFVQGIIDCYFEEGDGIVLIDYKTDRLYSESYLRELYSAQVSMYRDALEKITGKKVKESYIYSFCMGREILV